MSIAKRQILDDLSFAYSVQGCKSLMGEAGQFPDYKFWQLPIRYCSLIDVRAVTYAAIAFSSVPCACRMYSTASRAAPSPPAEGVW